MTFWSILSCALALAAPATAEPLGALQQAVDKAQAAVDREASEHERLHRDMLTALKRGAFGAFATAEQREQGAVVGALQATAALRRARQRLSEAINDAVEQGEAIERAAGRAARGEVAPSATDLLACAGPDCAPIPAREHTALVTMGAVAPNFDKSNWPPDDTTPVSMLVADVPLAKLRAEAEATANRAHDAAVAVEQTRAAVENAANTAAYAQALATADAARAAQAATAERLAGALRRYADAGRALKRAALLAGDGYVLKRGGHKACAHDTCVTSEGLEAAAFLVLGAAENMNDGLKNLASFVALAADGTFVFH